MSEDTTPTDGTDSDQDDVDADGSTTSTSKRHWLTNDVLAYLLVGTFPAIVILASVDVVDLGAVPGEVLIAWIAFAGTAVVWAYGPEAIEAWRGAR